MKVKLLKEAFKINGFLGSLGGSHDFGFAGRQGNCLLLLTTPRDGSATESKHPPSSRMFGGPVGIRHTRDWLHFANVVQTKLTGAVQVAGFDVPTLLGKRDGLAG